MGESKVQHGVVLNNTVLFISIEKKEFSLEVEAKHANIVLLSIGVDWLVLSQTVLPLNIPKQIINISLSLM